MTADLPQQSNANRDDRNDTSKENSFSLSVHGDVYLTPNDIAELRKLANEHPDLARQIVEDRAAAHSIENNTERLGMILAVVFGVSLVAGTSLTLVQLGWWQSIMFVAALLGISHVLRTLLKGEFSDTSWFGQIMTSTGKRKNSDNTDSESP